jgi:hypothetical protein
VPGQGEPQRHLAADQVELAADVQPRAQAAPVAELHHRQGGVIAAVLKHQGVQGQAALAGAGRQRVRAHAAGVGGAAGGQRRDDGHHAGGPDHGGAISAQTGW